MKMQAFNELFSIATELADFQYHQAGVEHPTERDLDKLAGKFQVELLKLVRHTDLQPPSTVEAVS